MPSPMIETLLRGACLHEWVEDEIRDDPGCALSSDPQREREEHLADATRLRELAGALEDYRESRPHTCDGIRGYVAPRGNCTCGSCALARLLTEEEPDGD